MTNASVSMQEYRQFVKGYIFARFASMIRVNVMLGICTHTRAGEQGEHLCLHAGFDNFQTDVATQFGAGHYVPVRNTQGPAMRRAALQQLTALRDLRITNDGSRHFWLPERLCCSDFGLFSFCAHACYWTLSTKVRLRVVSALARRL